MSRKLSAVLIILCLTAWSGNAKALLDFEVVGWTSTSVTFTVSGDFSGYARPPTASTIFSIVYDGDLWAGTDASTPNTWIPGSGPFTRIQVVSPGNTLFFNGKGFSFIQYSDALPQGSLVISPNQPISVRFDRRLNTLAKNPVFHFVWGGGAVENTLLDTWPDAVPNPALTLDKTSDVTTYSAPNDVINYTYRVESTGTGPVAGPITVNDNKVTVTCPPVSLVGNQDDNLDPGEILVCSASHIVIQADIDAGSITNTATAEGDGGATVSNSDQVTVTYQAPFVPVLTLNKSSDVLTYSALNDVINYTYNVASTGTGPIAGPITVNDNKVTVTCPPISLVGNQDDNLDPGEILVCSASHIVIQADIDAGSITNTATAEGDGGATVSNSDQVTVTYQAPTTYSVITTIANGNGTVNCNPADVQPGGSSTCTAVPDAGWQVSGWTGDCAATGTSTTCMLDNIQADQSSTVSFEEVPLTVVATVAAGTGTVSCDPSSVPPGGSSTCTAVPDTGSQVSGWTGACAGAGTSETCVLDNIQADQSSTVSFEIAPTYPVTVSVTGLVGSGLTEDSVELQNNGGDPILVTADATVSFPTELPEGATYDVTVAFQPDNQTCTVANGTGTVSGGPVFGPAVTCVDNSTNTSWFATSITFLNGDMGSVTATITCNGGVPLMQSFDISEGSPVEFTVRELKIDAADTTCEVTASDAGYDVLGSANAGTPAASCVFDTSNFATDGRNTCEFVATPMPTTLTVNTAIDSAGDTAIDPSFTTTLTCTNVSPDADDTFGTESISSDTSPLIVDWYPAPGGTSQCGVVMVPNSPAVEGGECSFSFMQGDAGAGCEVTGVVFFEGIPTLSRSGMLLMLLLMSVGGLIGIRRFT